MDRKNNRRYSGDDVVKNGRKYSRSYFLYPRLLLDLRPAWENLKKKTNFDSFDYMEAAICGGYAAS